MSRHAPLWILLLALIASCAHDQLAAHGDVGVIPLFSSDVSAVNTTINGSNIHLEIDNIANEGVYFSIPLKSVAVQSEQWTDDENVLHLAVPHAEFIDIGIVPLSGYAGTSISATIRIDQVARQSSDPPHGSINKVTDLSVTELVGGRVRLEWTEVNTGNYFNADGIVDLKDMTPLGMFWKRTDQEPGWEDASIADGDNDGRIGIADMTRIGLNYYSEVAGYVVKRGVPGDPPVWELVTPEPLDRNDYLDLPRPPHYVFETDGAFNDGWVVAPVDRYGIEGVGSDNGQVDRIDVLSSIAFAGSELWSLDGSAIGELAIGGYTMRVILPIDVPHRSPIVPPIDGPLGIMLFDGLPRQTRLMLDYVYAPVVDPATGDPAPYTAQLITSVPFALPASDQQLQLSAGIQLIPNAGPGPAYWLDSFITQDILGQQVLRHNRLDMASFTVASDTTGDGGFGDEAWLFDSDRDSVSDALLLRQQEYNAYDVTGAGELQLVQLRATATFYSMSDGKLVLGNDAEYYDAQAALWAPLPDAPLLLRFSEQTNFAELVNPGPNQFVRNFDPSTLSAGDEVIIYGYRLVDPTTLLDFHYWADRILRKVVQ